MPSIIGLLNGLIQQKVDFSAVRGDRHGQTNGLREVLGLEIVFPAAHRGEHLCRGISLQFALARKGVRQRRFFAAQEGVGGQFQRQGGRDRGLTPLPGSCCLLDPGLECLVIRLNRRGKGEVRQCVLMGAVNPRVRGEFGKRFQRLPHHRWCAFEDTPTATGEQGVTAEQQRLLAGMVERDVVECMPGNLEHGECVAKHFNTVAGAKACLHGLDCIVERAKDRRTVRLTQGLEAADVVEVMVGDEDGSQCELLLFQCSYDRRGVAWVYHAGLPRPGISEKPDVVVVKCGDRAYVKHQLAFQSGENTVVWVPLAAVLARHRNGNFMQSKCSDILAELESWYARDTVHYLLDMEHDAAHEMLATSFGYHILQLGMAGARPLSQSSPISHRIYCAEREADGVDLVAPVDELPLESDSVDTVIVHHCLEFAQRPHQVLREAQRVLTPQGELLVIGYNPYSLYGGYTRLRGLFRHPLWQHHRPVGENRLKDWLHLLGCEVMETRYLYNVPPAGSGRLRRWLTQADTWAARHNLPGGGVYMVHATKQVVGLTGQRRLRKGRRLIGLVPNPAPAPNAVGPVSKGYNRLKKGDVAA